MSEFRCPACRSLEVYHSSHHRHERFLKWLHPGRRLYHCHTCGRQFWTRGTRPSDPVPPELQESPGKTAPKSDKTALQRRYKMGLKCPSCGAIKTSIGRWWDDIWTSYRGHNKLYRCRRCNTMFAPPP